MKKSFFLTLSSILFSVWLYAQEKSDYYYYSGSKVYLQQSADKILLKFAPGASSERLQAIVGSDASLQSTSKGYLDENRSWRIAVLDAVNGSRVSASALQSFKSNAEVLSAEFLFQSGASLAGLTQLSAQQESEDFTMYKGKKF